MLNNKYVKKSGFGHLLTQPTVECIGGTMGSEIWRLARSADSQDQHVDAKQQLACAYSIHSFVRMHRTRSLGVDNGEKICQKFRGDRCGPQNK